VIRLLLLAPTPVARAGWRALLGADPAGDLAIVAEATASDDLTAQVAASQPDLLLLDPAPDDDALPAILQALTTARPGLGAIVLGSPGEGPAREALRAGARAYLRVAATGAEVAAAIRAVAQGLVVLDPAVAGPLLDRLTGQQTAPLPAPAPPPALSARELEVLQLLAQGLTNRGIARQLRISEHTAKFHVSALLTKLGAGSRAEAVALAMRYGLILV
jgi:two-component system nitrate/nitrite response regulator NarL